MIKEQLPKKLSSVALSWRFKLRKVYTKVLWKSYIKIEIFLFSLSWHICLTGKSREEKRSLSHWQSEERHLSRMEQTHSLQCISC